MQESNAFWTPHILVNDLLRALFRTVCLLSLVLAPWTSFAENKHTDEAGFMAEQKTQCAAPGAKQSFEHISATREIYFAGGCFWGMEEYFSRIPGVVDVTSGYANSVMPNPTYRQVCGGQTRAAEAVRIRYVPEIVTLTTLARQYFRIVDPVSVNRQGFDSGTQYRTGLYYTQDQDRRLLAAVYAEAQAACKEHFAVELMPLENFYEAEEYHQDYLRKYPGGYCHINFGGLSHLAEDAGTPAPEEKNR